MTLFPYALPVAAALLLCVFFAALPDLRRCALPRPAARRFTAADAAILAAIVLVYGAVAFRQLGNTASPETFTAMSGREVTLTLPEEGEPETLWLFPGVGAGSYAIEVSADGESFAPLQDFEQDYVAVLKWAELPLTDAPRPLRALRLRCVGGTPWLGEIAVCAADGSLLPLGADIPALCDEGGTVPDKSDFMNSSYFDEIYHARTAWEHLNGVWPYEISHPPLGKELLSLGVLLFGMTPFGWRFSGTLFGLLMLPVMYLLLKRLFGGRAVPACGTLLLATDFMHFVQTRIATIDTYAVFFILLMYLFLYVWLEDGRPWALALCGLSFGLGAASKWTALYAGAGLAVLWALHWLEAFFLRPKRPSCHSDPACHPNPSCHPERSEGSPTATRPDPSRHPERSEGSPTATRPDPAFHPERSEGSPTATRPDPEAVCSHRRGACPSGYNPSSPSSPSPLPAFLKNAAFCLVFFVALPCAIYYLSYLPYGRAAGYPLFSRDYLRLVLDNQRFMFTYHAGLQAEHPYASRWYQWLLDIRPILYYLEYFPDGSHSSICAFLNPLLCWGGLLSLFVLGYTALFRGERRAGFVLVGYLAQLLPWVFISRLTFAYHYFPASVFLVLALGYVFALLRDNRRDGRLWMLGFTLLSAALFALFYPALSGLPYGAPGTPLERLLQWLPTWPI